MLLACITNPSQIDRANSICDGVELRSDCAPFKPRGLILLKSESLPLPQLSVEPDYIDLPWEISFDKPEKRIASYHNFEETPEDLDALFSQMQKVPAHAYKIATMAKSSLDALRMLAFVKRNQNHRLIGLCMGEEGIITRILSPVVGNFWNYTFTDVPVAPGQLSVETLLSTYNYRSLTPQTALYGLIGNPIIQSPSHQTHNAFFREKSIDAVYVRMRLDEHELGQALVLMKEIGFKGLSVTIPYKEKILPFIDHLDPFAGAIGAVNTLKFTPNGIEGYNTDAKGGIDALQEPLEGKRIVCLGAGGSAKALAYEARQRGAEVHLFNRAGMAEGIPNHYDILINTTPNPCPIEQEAIVPGCTVMDINVKHTGTEFLKAALAKNCRVVLGMEMFWRQALGQFQIWNLIP